MTSHPTPLMIRFLDTKPRVLLELTNTTARTLKSIEILTVFLKDEESPGGPSRERFRFDRINSVQPNAKAVVSHRTYLIVSPNAYKASPKTNLTVFSLGNKRLYSFFGSVASSRLTVGAPVANSVL